MILYTIGIYIFGFFIRLTSIFNSKAKLWIVGRVDILKKLKLAKIAEQPYVIWFHCASLGEFEQARPVIEEIKKTHSKYKILLTFFSPSGYEIRKNYKLADWVFYICLDTKSNAKIFIELTNPMIAIFVKYEFWYNHIAELNYKNIPTYSLSAIFRKDQYFFSWKKYIIPNPLKLFTLIFVQDIDSQKLLKTINIDSTVIGDTRFDSVKTFLTNKKSLTDIEKFKDKNFLLVVGSAWQEDIDLISQIDYSQFPKFKIIIAPHLIDNETIEKISNAFSTKCYRYSEGGFENAKILIIDNIGMLSSIYQYADLAYIGGAFGSGLHNILEPAVYGIPVIFGENYQKFNEAIALIKLKGAFSIKNYYELEKRIKSFYFDEIERINTGEICSTYVEQNSGATALFLEKINLTS